MKPFKHLTIKLLLSITIAISITIALPQKALALECPNGYRLVGNLCCKELGKGSFDFDCRDTAEPIETDEDRCKEQGGRWDADEGHCYGTETSQIDCDESCPPGTEKIEHRGPGVHYCECREVLFEGEGQKIRVHVTKCDQGIPGLTDPTFGIQTAIGCIPTDPSAFVGWVFKLGTFLGGGIAFLLMAWGTFLTMTSAGDPEKLKQGKDIIVSAVSGLLFIIFAVFLLRLIGVDILQIPGFQ